MCERGFIGFTFDWSDTSSGCADCPQAPPRYPQRRCDAVVEKRCSRRSGPVRNVESVKRHAFFVTVAFAVAVGIFGCGGADDLSASTGTIAEAVTVAQGATCSVDWT